jgi:hypothetical protein
MVIIEEGVKAGAAKLKRKLKRLLEMLQVGVKEVSSPILTPQPAVKRQRISDAVIPLSVPDEEPIGTSQQITPVDDSVPGNFPYVVFVGQLSFTTTKEAIEEHFRAGGVGGVMTVRLLTSKGSENSRGMAFVEIEGSKELRNALAMHHTTLDGRRVNVEQSAGGGKRKRSEAIEAKRSDRQEPRQKVMRAPPPLASRATGENGMGEAFEDIEDGGSNLQSWSVSGANRGGRHGEGRGGSSSRGRGREMGW